MASEEPFLTVFSPNYNGERFIAETIESILNQTYSNFEYIIIDDGSTDNSWQIIQKYAKQDSRIKPYRNKDNIKVVRTRNRGLKLSSTDSKYFAIIDSDDISHPRRLELQIKFLEHNPEYGLVGSNKFIINEQSEIIGYRSYPSTNSEIKRALPRYNPIAQSSVVLRKVVINQLGNYDPKLTACQDYDYWLRVGINWKLRNLEYPLIKYRLSKNQIKSRNLEKTIRYTLLIQKRAIKQYGYKDSIFLKIYRIVLKSSLIYPKLLYLLYIFRFTEL